jgi:hypothetical protein
VLSTLPGSRQQRLLGSPAFGGLQDPATSSSVLSARHVQLKAHYSARFPKSHGAEHSWALLHSLKPLQQVLARAALHLLTYVGRDADAWVPRDTVLQLRCRTADRRQHPLYGDCPNTWSRSKGLCCVVSTGAQHPVAAWAGAEAQLGVGSVLLLQIFCVAGLLATKWCI